MAAQAAPVTGFVAHLPVMGFTSHGEGAGGGATAPGAAPGAAPGGGASFSGQVFRLVWVVYKGRAIARKLVQALSVHKLAQPKNVDLIVSQVYVVGAGHENMHKLAAALEVTFAARRALHAVAQKGIEDAA
jgi:hypothetical protein